MLCSPACSRRAQAALQQHQHCIALLSHRESGSSQHHTAVNSCLHIPVPLHCSVTDRAQHAADGHQQHCCQKLFTNSGPLHCRVTDTAQHASHSMQQKGTSSTAASPASYSIAVTQRGWFITASYCCQQLLTDSSPTALQGD